MVGVSGGGRSIVSLEDPIESEVQKVAQSQIKPAAGFTFATGLRSLMRQDPEVILVGEIRDRETAEVAFQAALTGQLLLSSFHSGSAAGAITRLSDMGIESYLLRSGLRAIICQRLVRRLCKCSVDSHDANEWLGLQVEKASNPVGCKSCRNTGYQGRLVLAEMLDTEEPAIRRAILSQSDTAQLEQAAVEAGMTSRWHRACDAVESGLTSPEEIRRVLGFASANH